MDFNEDIEEVSSYGGVPATIILINAFDNTKSETLKVAHVATCRHVRQHLKYNHPHHVCVCFFGMEEVLEVFPLTLPTLDDFMKLQNIDLSTLQPAKKLIISDSLSHCSKKFNEFKKKMLSKTIIILSNLEVPPVESDHSLVLNRVKILIDADVDIKLINISSTESKVDSFYQDFLIEVHKVHDIDLPKPMLDEKQIEALIHNTTQSHRHLAVAKLGFEIGEGLSIGVGVYKLLKSSGHGTPKSSSLDRDTNAVLTRFTKTVKVSVNTDKDMDVDENTPDPKETPLLKSEQLYYQRFGEERIEFTDIEMKPLKNPFGPPILKLLGFKPAVNLRKDKWFVKNGYFLFPNEGIIEGSTVAFKALHQACIEMNVVAIAVLCTRANARPFNVALSPCSKPLGLDVELGFDVIIIPFAEDVRDIPIEQEEKIDISKTHKTIMVDLIKCLKFDYVPNMFENPKFQALYRAIEAKALEEEDIEPFVDTTKPGPERFQNLPEELFYDIFGPFGTTGKRPSESSQASKKIKTEVDPIEIDQELLQSRLTQKKVAAYNVVDLKQILKSKNITNLPALTGKKKQELVDLVYQYCECDSNL